MVELTFFLLFLTGLLFFVFWIIMLIDAITRKFKEDSEKVIWVLVIIFTAFIGALIYYFVVYEKYKTLAWFWYALIAIVAVLVIWAGFF
jgi:uncharacterized membrane-anchored protein